MCSPTAALGAQAAGVGMSTVASIFEASGMKSGLRAQARIDEINATMKDEDGRRALMSGQKHEQKLRLAAAQLKSKQRVAMGANSVDMTEGSALNTLVSTDYMTEVDANTIQMNALEAAWGHRTQALNYRNDAVMKRGQASAISPAMAGAASLISGAGKVAASWYSLSENGAFSGAGEGGKTLSGSGFMDPSTQVGHSSKWGQDGWVKW